jgi:hypothetical protein
MDYRSSCHPSYLADQVWDVASEEPRGDTAPMDRVRERCHLRDIIVAAPKTDLMNAPADGELWYAPHHVRQLCTEKRKSKYEHVTSQSRSTRRFACSALQ